MIVIGIGIRAAIRVAAPHVTRAIAGLFTGAVIVEMTKKDEESTSTNKGAKEVHGNSSKSTKKQHTYDIVDKDGNVDKVGLSGGKISKKGKSYRGEQSVRQREKEQNLKKGELTSRITRQDIPGRKKGLFSESHQRGKRRAEGEDLLGNREKGETSRIRDRENANKSIDNDGGQGAGSWNRNQWLLTCSINGSQRMKDELYPIISVATL